MDKALETMLFIACFIAIPFFWRSLLRLSGVRLLTVSVPGFLVAVAIISQYIGYPILFFNLDDFRALQIDDRYTLWKMFLCSSYTITMTLFGFVAARKILGPLHGPNKWNSFSSPFQRAAPVETLFVVTIFIISLAVLIAYIRTVGIHNLALLQAVGVIETDLTTAALRSSMGNSLPGAYHWFRLFMRDFLSIASLAFLAAWIIHRRRSAFVMFLLSFLVATFSMIMATEKAPLIWYLVSISLVCIIILRNGRLSYITIALLAFVGLVVIGVMYVLFMGSGTFWGGLAGGLSRITTGQMIGLYHYLMIFPEQVGYLYGHSFPNPGGIFPWEPYRLSLEVMNIVRPELSGRGVVGSMPTFFWGEMYANFGYVGILVPPFFIGFIVYAINILFFRLPMTPFILSVFIWYLQHIRGITGSGLSAYIFDVTGFIIFSATLVVLVLKGGGAIRYRKKLV